MPSRLIRVRTNNLLVAVAIAALPGLACSSAGDCIARVRIDGVCLGMTEGQLRAARPRAFRDSDHVRESADHIAIRYFFTGDVPATSSPRGALVAVSLERLVTADSLSGARELMAAIIGTLDAPQDSVSYSLRSADGLPPIEVMVFTWADSGTVRHISVHGPRPQSGDYIVRATVAVPEIDVANIIGIRSATVRSMMSR
jgi:hypothetical protein